ncbi:hypothetical protein MKX03_018954 [Papaver bracteatum]|nr:hypothetical protein MKX03_018954 [Papaver bracteatum]
MYLMFPLIFLMESVSCKWILLSFLLISLENSALCAVDGVKGGKVRGVNLGGWLVVEGWMSNPSLFKDIPENDMLDGTRVRFQSLSSNMFVSAKGGGGEGVFVNQGKASTWETFRLWRVSQSEYQLRAINGQFLSCAGDGASVTAKSGSPSLKTGTFTIERSREDGARVRIKISNGNNYLQASSPGNELTAEYAGTPGWDDSNAAIFKMTFDGGQFQGEYQLSNGYGPEKAKQVLTDHRNSYITREDFQFLSQNGINTVRIPVGWWITKDPNPPPPYVGGSLAVLDKAFAWAKETGIKCIIDLHAAPGSQNGKDHSSSRDGSIEWAESDNIPKSLKAIDFLASKYANHPALLGIELLNEPNITKVSPDILKKYYRDGYDIVRRYSPKAYVIMSQMVGEGSDKAGVYKAIAEMGLSNVVVDFHYYNLYSDMFFDKGVKFHIDFVRNQRKHTIESRNAANGPLVFIGEWVNEFGREGKEGWSAEDYRNFGKAQLEVFGSASFGWAYWSIKNDNHNKEHWSFMWNINQTYLQLEPVT